MYGASIEAQEDRQWTALLIATQDGHLGAVEVRSPLQITTSSLFLDNDLRNCAESISVHFKHTN